MGQSRGTLVLKRSDVARLAGMKEAIAALEPVFIQHAEGRASNLTRNFDAGGRNVSIKVGYSGPSRLACLKSLGLVVLNDLEDLRRPLAIFEQAQITWLRTGAAGALAAKHLARPDSETAALIGSGRQARAQAHGLKEVFPGLKAMRVWSPSRENREAFASEMTAELGIPVAPSSSARSAAEGADIIVTATRAREPVIEDAWIRPGSHLNAIGADLPGMQELPAALLKRARVYADDIDQALWMGASNVPISRNELARSDLQGTLGQVVAGVRAGRVSPSDVTVFDCSGLGMMDLALASALYELALKTGCAPMFLDS